MRPAVFLAAGFLALGLVASAGAQSGSAGGIELAGHVDHAQHMPLADMEQMLQYTIDVTFLTSHGQQTGHFSGPLLWDVVQKAGITDEAGAKAKHHLQHTVLVTGRDGYQVAVSIGEIDPEFEGKNVILVTDNNEVRLVVPADKSGGRNVHDVVRVEVE